jgi:hypothetical protein
MDWADADTETLFETIRQRGPAADAERVIWAFERALAIARIDPTLVDHMLVACVCLRAVEEGTSPRTILEHRFRRAVSDADWNDRFAPLFA